MIQASRTETPHNILRYNLVQDLSSDHAGKSDLDPFQKGIGINPYLLMKPMNFSFAESNARGCIANEEGEEGEEEESKVIELMNIDANPVEPSDGSIPAAGSGPDINFDISSSTTRSGKRLLASVNNPGTAVNHTVGSETPSRSIPAEPQMSPPTQTPPPNVGDEGKRVVFSLPQGPKPALDARPKLQLEDVISSRRQSPIKQEPLEPSENSASSDQKFGDPMSATQCTWKVTPEAVLGSQKTIIGPLNDTVRSIYASGNRYMLCANYGPASWTSQQC